MPNCIFCKIVRGELPSIKVYEDEGALAFLTIQPTNTGHTLVIPKNHSVNILEISSDEWGRVMKTVHTVASAVRKGVGADAINLQVVGEEVPHTHIHIIPRFKDDGLKLWPHHDRRDEEGEPIATKIRAAL